MNQFFTLTSNNVALSSTSANHLANLAKEFYKIREDKLNAISFLTVSKGFLDSDTQKVTSKESLKGILEEIPQLVKDIQQCKALIAWLREAIKNKQDLITRSYSKDDFYKEFPQYKVEDTYAYRKDINEIDWLNTLSTAKLSQYYKAQAKAAVLGETILNKGNLNKAKEQYFKRLSNPIDVQENGRDSIVTSYSSEFSSKEIEGIFYSLQKEFREAQATFNSFLAEKDAWTLNEDKKQEELYSNKYSEYLEKRKEADSAYYKARQEYDDKINNLKICIPDNLYEIYQKVNNLGK